MRDSLPWEIKGQQINVKIYSTLLAIEEMQIKIMINYCCIPVRTAKIKKIMALIVCKDTEKLDLW